MAGHATLLAPIAGNGTKFYLPVLRISELSGYFHILDVQHT
jgi:hypothetical protein